MDKVRGAEHTDGGCPRTREDGGKAAGDETRGKHGRVGRPRQDEKQKAVQEEKTQTPAWSELFGGFFDEDGRLKAASAEEFWGRLQGAFGAMLLNPYIQNNRFKAISTLPADYNKDNIAGFLRNPYGSEQELRGTAHALEYSAYPYFKIRKSYQDIPTYRWYNMPLERGTGQSDAEVLREWRLCDKLCRELDLKAEAHRITGQALQEGKVFYILRCKVDKSHNAVRHAFLQQLPSDFCKIVGVNSLTKYTVAFNMAYFLNPGTDMLQYGDLFLDCFDDFAATVGERGGKKPRAEELMRRYRERVRTSGKGNEEVYRQGGQWYYWVTLPPDAVWTFEIDDASPAVFSPFTGLMLAMEQVSQYEQIQLNLVTNPLVSVLTGEIPYRNDGTASKDDQYKMSISGREFFQRAFDRFMADHNTSGVGLYLAPAENLRLQQLAEAPSSTEISAKGYEYAMLKAGLAALLPASSEPRAGMAQLSAKLESRFTDGIYRTFERMLGHTYRQLGLRAVFALRMFGDCYSDESALKAAKEGMTLGILPDTLRYLALQDRQLSDEIETSQVIKGTGLLEARIPLSSTYTGGAAPAAERQDRGRPQTGGITSEGKENDADVGRASGD